MAVTLTSCGDAELYHDSASATQSDHVITIRQNGDEAWSFSSKEEPQTPNVVLPLGAKIALLFSPTEDGHAVSISELGINLGANAGETSEAWAVVRKPVTVKLRCANHPDENTGLTLQFE